MGSNRTGIIERNGPRTGSVGRSSHTFAHGPFSGLSLGNLRTVPGRIGVRPPEQDDNGSGLGIPGPGCFTEDGMKEIPLTQGKVALVDDRDYALLMRLAPWHAHKAPRTFYAVHSFSDERGRGRPIRKFLMHHVIMGRKYDGRDVDHIDCNGLNNQRANLRWSTRSQNRANSAKPRSGANQFKGVSLNKRLGKFCAYITVRGKRMHLGVFSNETDAARAYDRAAREHFGAFAKCNLA